MAVGQVVLTLFGVGVFLLALTSLGNQILLLFHYMMESDGEYLLVATAVGLVATEILIFLLQLTQHIKQGCWSIAALLCVVIILDPKSIWTRIRRALRSMCSCSKGATVLFLISAVVLLVGFLSALAPLTGSDALHYHFTVQKEILEHGFHPIFSNSHSFLCGQHHLLILFGLAWGSEKLALGLIFLGGMLTAAALVCLASLWARDWIVAGIALLFLVTPVIFWQISSSGAPDIYMALLASTAVLVLRQPPENDSWKQVLIAGFLTGGIAGAKYTGCLVAIAFAVAVLIEFRIKITACIFVPGALMGGIWPYVRNLFWTGNPLFPFLSAKLSPHLVTLHAVKSLESDTGALSVHDLGQVFPFLFFASIQKNSPGFWDFFGPLVLSLAPLILFAFQNTRAWRVSLFAWLLSGLGIFLASGLPRFLLPVFPIGLACAAAGFDFALREKWTVASRTAMGVFVFMVCTGSAGFLMYVHRPLRAAIGLQSETEYLQQRSQDFEVTEAVNRLLRGQTNQKKALVFIRHLYYLDIPFVNGDPDTSFEVDPAQLQTPQEWKAFLEKEGICYVVRSPNYPKALAAPLNEMEIAGDLVPIARADVINFQGKRIDENRIVVPVVILKVNR
jgi:hypothetical protein